VRIAVSLLNFRPGLIGGAETYIRNMLAAFEQARGGDEIVLVGWRGNLDDVGPAGIRRVDVDKGDWSIVAARVFEAFTPYRAGLVERVFQKLDADVALFPQQSIFPKAIAGPTVLIVHDVQHLLFPHRFRARDRMFRRAAYPRSLRRADRIIAISQFTADILVERCGVCRDRIAVVHPGLVGCNVDAIEPYDEIPGPFLYYPAASFPHKGHEQLFETFAKLRERSDFPYKLLLTGQRTAHWRGLRKRLTALGIGEDVMHLGFVPPSDVLRLYKAAAAVVFPSQFEGFGQPALEATELGAKFICSRLPVFAEIGIPQQWQIDFADPDQLLAALGRPGPTVLDKPAPTWAEAAERMLDVIRGAAC